MIFFGGMFLLGEKTVLCSGFGTKKEDKKDYTALFEEKPIRRRARPDKNKSDTEWIWNDDKVINN